MPKGKETHSRKKVKRDCEESSTTGSSWPRWSRLNLLRPRRNSYYSTLMWMLLPQRQVESASMKVMTWENWRGISARHSVLTRRCTMLYSLISSRAFRDTTKGKRQRKARSRWLRVDYQTWVNWVIVFRVRATPLCRLPTSSKLNSANMHPNLIYRKSAISTIKTRKMQLSAHFLQWITPLSVGKLAMHHTTTSWWRRRSWKKSRNIVMFKSQMQRRRRKKR